MKQSVLVIVGSSTSYHHALRDQAIDGSGYDKRCHSWPSVRGMCYCSRNFLHCLVCGARDGGGGGGGRERGVGKERSDRELWGRKWRDDGKE